MFSFSFDYSNYRDLLADFAKSLNTPLTSDYKFVFPKEYAIGYMQTLKLPNNLQILIFDYTLVQDFYGKRNEANKEYYILWLTEAEIPVGARFLVENNRLETKTTNFTSVMLTSSLFDLNFEAKKGTRFNGLNIILTKEWLQKEFGLTNTDKVLQKYLAINTQKISSEVLSVEYKKIWNEILELADSNSYLREVAVQNRAMQLVELFLSNISKRLHCSENNLISLSREDINRMMKAEKFLCEDLFAAPPSLKAIAEHVGISEAKLKNNFKLVYNFAPHQHFQKKRMLVARDLLIMGKYNIKKIATEFGFNNQYNFTLAFKKEFGILPSQLQV